jgi:hypothetical protein
VRKFSPNKQQNVFFLVTVMKKIILKHNHVKHFNHISSKGKEESKQKPNVHTNVYMYMLLNTEELIFVLRSDVLFYLSSFFQWIGLSPSIQVIIWKGCFISLKFEFKVRNSNSVHFPHLLAAPSGTHCFPADCFWEVAIILPSNYTVMRKRWVWEYCTQPS